MLLRDIADLLLPRHCVACGERLTAAEQSICTNCLVRLPLTNYHLVKENLLEKQFWGLFPIQHATSLFHYEGRGVQHIIHAIKYWGRPDIGTQLAASYSEVLKESDFFHHIDAIVPLPLHWMRQLKRHYNQSHYIAQGISQATGLPVYKNAVKRVKNNSSQTRLTHRERIQNVKGIFQLSHPETIAGKHILLVDDVTTTGATLTSCAQTLAQAPDTTISIFTLAVAARTPVPAVQNTSPETSVFGIPLME